nr:hypothetical protein [Pseudomonas sp.]
MPKLKISALLISFALTISGCAKDSRVAPLEPLLCPRPAPVPVAVMQEQPADFSEQMRNFLFDSQDEPTQ